jgi:hypothetical protein
VTAGVYVGTVFIVDGNAALALYGLLSKVEPRDDCERHLVALARRAAGAWIDRLDVGRDRGTDGTEAEPAPAELATVKEVASLIGRSPEWVRRNALAWGAIKDQRGRWSFARSDVERLVAEYAQ